jgi:hypothetical protein
MASPLAIETPTGFAPEDDLPIPSPPGTPLWSESYCFVASDAAAQVGVWTTRRAGGTQLGRTAWDVSLWPEFAGDARPMNGYRRSHR